MNGLLSNPNIRSGLLQAYSNPMAMQREILRRQMTGFTQPAQPAKIPGMIRDIANTMKGNAQEMWAEARNPKPYPTGLLDALQWQRGMLEGPVRMPPPVDPNDMATLGMEFLQPMSGLLGMTAWHGTPHLMKGNKVDLSKVGTGEGAQAYGHGFYAAEGKGTAKYYADALTRDTPYKFDLLTADENALTPDWVLRRIALAEETGDAKYLTDEFTALKADYVDRISKESERVKNQPWLSNTQGLENDLRIIEKLEKSGNLKHELGGHLYELDIPDEHINKMLDWDKPLSEQPESVRKAIETNTEWVPQNLAEWTGGEYYKRLGKEVAKKRGKFPNLSNDNAYPGTGLSPDQVQAIGSESLNSLGIPGIRYLDGTSRGAGEGTRNFVIFDENIVTPLSRNGEPINALSPKPLPMDEASRMQRAGEMGFGGDLYHASKQDITEFVPGYEDGLTFLTDNQNMANSWLGKGKYNRRIGADKEIEAAENAYSQSRRQAFDWDALNKMEAGPEFNKVFDDASAKFREANPVTPDDLYNSIYPVRSNVKNTFDPQKDYKVIEDFLKKQPGMDEAIKKGTHKRGNWLVYENKAVVDELKRLGYDSMRITENIGGPHETLAVFDPKNIRSRFAAFDPAKKDSANILAGAAGAGLGLGLLAPYYQDRPNP